MRRPLTASLATIPFAVVALSACSQDSSGEATQEYAVADGVLKQYDVLAEEVAEKGQTVESGPWTVHLITEAAEPWHEVPSDGATEFREPATGETNHIEIIPVESATGRVIPDVPITLEVVDSQNAPLQKLDLNFYYSTFFHYANNFSIAQPGEYTVRATLGVPAFNRHGEAAEQPPLTEGTTVEFEDVHLGPES